MAHEDEPDPLLLLAGAIVTLARKVSTLAGKVDIQAEVLSIYARVLDRANWRIWDWTHLWQPRLAGWISR